jgi:hypothetical protein
MSTPRTDRLMTILTFLTVVTLLSAGGRSPRRGESPTALPHEIVAIPAPPPGARPHDPGREPDFLEPLECDQLPWSLYAPRDLVGSAERILPRP